MLFNSLFKKFKNKRKLLVFKKKYGCNVGDFIIYNSKTEVGKGCSVINSEITSSIVGDYTYIRHDCYLPKCKIGKFCSIANNVIVSPINHNYNNLSTHPMFENNNDNKLSITKNGYYCEIGNDVWIGEHVLIKGGVVIGDGSVIGMGAVVTHDVPPYAIVCGIPAKVIKYRFSENIIKKMLDIKWWDFDISVITKNIEYFRTPIKLLEIFNKESKKEK